LNAVSRQTVRDGLFALKAITEFEYDDPLTKGNVKYRRHWDDAKAGCSPSVPLSLSCPAQHREYDATGNLIDVFEPEIRTHITYSGPYPSSVEYAPGTSASRSFSYAWNNTAGVLASQTDVQTGAVTTYGYDAFGRQSLVDENGVRLTETVYNDANRTVLLKRDLRSYGDGSLQTVSHTDQLGRVVLVRTGRTSPESFGYGRHQGQVDVPDIRWRHHRCCVHPVSKPFRRDAGMDLHAKRSGGTRGCSRCVHRKR
jgi:hypothetical protein